MDNTKVAIILTPDLIIDPLLQHYILKDNEFYGTCKANSILFYNYSTIILEKNNLLVEKLKDHSIFDTFVFNDDFTLTTNVELLSIILKNKNSNESKKFILQKIFITAFSIFVDYIGEELNEYVLELEENFYYNLVSYFINIKTGSVCIDSLDYIGASDNIIDNLIRNQSDDFYRKKFQSMEENNTCLSECFIYGIGVFVEYSTPIQQILYSLYNFKYMRFECLHKMNYKMKETLEIICGIYSITSYLKTIKISNKDTEKFYQNILLPQTIVTLTYIPDSEIFFAGTTNKTFYIIAFQGKKFEIIGKFRPLFNFFIEDNIIKYDSVDSDGFKFLYMIEDRIVLIKANIWKMYFLRYKTIIEEIPLNLFDYNGELYDNATDQHIEKYYEYMCQKYN